MSQLCFAYCIAAPKSPLRGASNIVRDLHLDKTFPSRHGTRSGLKRALRNVYRPKTPVLHRREIVCLLKHHQFERFKDRIGSIDCVYT